MSKKRVSDVILGKKDIIQKIVDIVGSDVSKATITKVMDNFLKALGDSISRGQSIKFVGYLTIDVLHREARVVRNPSTGDLIKSPEKSIIKIKPGSKLKKNLDLLKIKNKKKKQEN